MVWATPEAEELGRIPVDIIVGVGNPGSRYASTRHNLGFDVVDVLACRYEIAMQRLVAEAICGQGKDRQSHSLTREAADIYECQWASCGAFSPEIYGSGRPPGSDTR